MTNHCHVRLLDHVPCVFPLQPCWFGPIMPLTHDVTSRHCNMPHNTLLTKLWSCDMSSATQPHMKTTKCLNQTLSEVVHFRQDVFLPPYLLHVSQFYKLKSSWISDRSVYKKHDIDTRLWDSYTFCCVDQYSVDCSVQIKPLKQRHVCQVSLNLWDWNQVWKYLLNTAFNQCVCVCAIVSLCAHR